MTTKPTSKSGLSAPSLSRNPPFYLCSCYTQRLCVAGKDGYIGADRAKVGRAFCRLRSREKRRLHLPLPALITRLPRLPPRRRRLSPGPQPPAPPIQVLRRLLPPLVPPSLLPIPPLRPPLRRPPPPPPPLA